MIFEIFEFGIMLLMKTREISRGALLCALYGVLLEINNLTSLSIESLLPVLFGLPIMVCALTSNQKVVQAVLYSMMVLTFLLSGMTTWLYAIGILISAYVLCLPFIRTKKSSKNQTGSQVLFNRHQSSTVYCIDQNFGWCLIVQVGCVFLSMTLFAGLFGYSATQDQALFALPQGIISPTAILFLISFIAGLLQAVLLDLLLQVILMLMYHGKVRVKIPLSRPIRSIPMVLVLSLSGVVLLMNAPVLKWTMICKDVLLIISITILIWLDILGTISLLHHEQAKSKNRPWLRIAIVLSAYIPPICLIPIGYGMKACLTSKSETSRGYMK